MTLLIPEMSGHFFTYDNWGANPSATIGTSVVPGASSAEGSWTQVAAAASITTNIYGIYMQAFGGATSASAKNHMLDIGIDPAGGTSYTAIISDIIVGDSPSLTQAGNREFYFPFYIPSGSSIAVRIQGSAATAGTVMVAMKFYGKPSIPGLPVGRFSETIGTGASTLGTSFTPGSAADGSWASLGTTSKNLWWWQLGYQINNGTITAEYTYLELAYGDATNKVTIFKMMHGGTTGETAGLAAQTQLLWHAAYCPVPAGTNIYIRGRANNPPDSGYNASAVGIGG